MTVSQRWLWIVGIVIIFAGACTLLVRGGIPTGVVYVDELRILNIEHRANSLYCDFPDGRPLGRVYFELRDLLL